MSRSQRSRSHSYIKNDFDPVTPRTRMWKKKRRSAQIIVDVMTCLDAEKVASIQREFVQHPDNAVDVKEFVRIMEDHLENFVQLREKMYQGVTRSEEEVDEVTRTDLLLNLRELFDEIDINGDQLMEWTEFTAFISEKAGLTNAIGLDSITEYREVMVGRKSKRAKPFQQCFYVQPLDAVAAIDDYVPVVHMYSAETGNPLAELKSSEVTGMPVAMEYVGKPVVRRFDTPGTLAVACADSSIVAWQLDHRSKKHKQYDVHSAWPTPHTQMSLKWFDRHQLLFSGSVAGTVHAWDVEKRDEVTCLIGHTDMVLDLCSLDTIESVASCSLDTTISIWDILTGSRRQLLQGHRMGVTSMAYHEERRLLFSSGFDHEALVWSPFTPTVLFKLKGHTKPLVGVNVVPNSNQVVTADTDGFCKVWDVRTFQCVQSYSMDHAKASTGGGGMSAASSGGGQQEDDSFQFTDHQKLYAFTTCHSRPRHLSETSTVRLVGVSLRLNFYEQRPVNVDTGGADDLPVRCAMYNSVLCSVLTAHGPSVKIWSALTGSLSRTFSHLTANGSDITALCMDDRQRKFIIGDHKGDIQVHNYQSGAFMKSFDPHLSQVSSLIYIDDVKQVVSSSWDGAIVLHDENPADHGQILRTMDTSNTHRGDVTCTAVSLEQQLIVTGAADKTVRVWDMTTGKVLQVLSFDYEVNNVAFLEPFPAIVVADTIGWCHVYGIRGSRFKYHCPLKFRHLYRHGGARPDVDDLIIGTIENGVRQAPGSPWRKGGGNNNEESSESMEDLPFMSLGFSNSPRVGGGGGGGAEGKESMEEGKEGKEGTDSQNGGQEGKEGKEGEQEGKEGKETEHIPPLQTKSNTDGRRDGRMREEMAEGEKDTFESILSPVLALVWRRAEQILYTGGDRGQISAFDLAPAMKELGSKDPAFGVKASPRGRMTSTAEDLKDDELGGSARLERVRSNSLFSNSRGTSPNGSPRGYASVAIKDEYSPILKESKARLLWSVRGHGDSIASLEIVEEPRALLSASYDHTVRLWGTDGDARGVRLGSLLQGIRGKMRHPKWNFHVDIEEMENKETSDIQSLMVDLEKRRSTMKSFGEENGRRQSLLRRSSRGSDGGAGGGGGSGSGGKSGEAVENMVEEGEKNKGDMMELDGEWTSDREGGGGGGETKEGGKSGEEGEEGDSEGKEGSSETMTTTKVAPPWKKAEINNSSRDAANSSLSGLNDNGPGPAPTTQSPGLRRGSERGASTNSRASFTILPEVPDHPDDYDQASYEQFQKDWFKDHPNHDGGGSPVKTPKKTNGSKKKSPSFSMSKGVRNPHRRIGRGSKRAAVSFDRAMEAASKRDQEMMMNSLNREDDEEEVGEEERRKQRAITKMKMDRLRSKLAKYGFDGEGNDMYS